MAFPEPADRESAGFNTIRRRLPVNVTTKQMNCAKSDVRPFRVQVPEAELVEMRRRINATRLPEKEPVADSSQGVPLATIEKLRSYWADRYDWRRCEAALNAVTNFVTEIDGLDIHFIHVRSKHEDALPLIITHGWPYSVAALLKIIDPLTNPTIHGGTASDAFHVVLPSLPGYGFSSKPVSTGWGPDRIARAWASLMSRLGYLRYVAQGGDWGAIVTDVMAAQAPPGLIGMHTNMPAVIPPEIDKLLWARGPLPTGLSADEILACDMLAVAYKKIQYASYMASRPQTLYGTADSPVGLAAWLIDFPFGVDMMVRIIDDQPENLTRDDVLDNCSIYWLTNTGVSSSRLYRENKFNFFAPKDVRIPVAVSVFPDEIYQAPLSWT
jgi:pimeloyl-ACP methyl ester carboxylesterase